jgi:hypothetical protein
MAYWAENACRGVATAAGNKLARELCGTLSGKNMRQELKMANRIIECKPKTLLEIFNQVLEACFSTCEVSNLMFE